MPAAARRLDVVRASRCGVSLHAIILLNPFRDDDVLIREQRAATGLQGRFIDRDGANLNQLFLNTVLLGGTTNDKIQAVSAAGFDQIELWQQDLDAFPQGAQRLGLQLRQARVGLTDYQVLLDFDGAPNEIRGEKRTEALRMFDDAICLGAKTILVPASTRKDCVPGRIDEDMKWLCSEAAQRGLRIAYEAMAWSTVNSTTPAAWELVKRLDQSNLGLVIDAFHLFSKGRTINDVVDIPDDRIYLVQLSDHAGEIDPARIVQIARHNRLLPGNGSFPLTDLVRHLQDIDYGGPIGLEVFNDELKSQPPHQAAGKAMASLLKTWHGL
ncbi:4-hydroxyphenylpyruvate dioxygenase (plasmid) [Neorhizobium sp. NCHU2750]|nr:4-hydroxyphenylpyruvate dioxygenase [Neorhizobium sp. NCHU2750]